MSSYWIAAKLVEALRWHATLLLTPPENQAHVQEAENALLRIQRELEDGPDD